MTKKRIWFIVTTLISCFMGGLYMDIFAPITASAGDWYKKFQQNRSLDNKIADAKTQIVSIEKQIELFPDYIESAEKELLKKRGEWKKLTEKHTESNALMLQFMRALTSLKTDTEEFVFANGRYNKRTGELQAKLMIKELVYMKDSIKKLEAETAEIERAIAQMRTQKDELQYKLKEAKESLSRVLAIQEKGTPNLVQKLFGELKTLEKQMDDINQIITAKVPHSKVEKEEKKASESTSVYKNFDEMIEATSKKAEEKPKVEPSPEELLYQEYLKLAKEE